MSNIIQIPGQALRHSKPTCNGCIDLSKRAGRKKGFQFYCKKSGLDIKSSLQLNPIVGRPQVCTQPTKVAKRVVVKVAKHA